MILVSPGVYHENLLISGKSVTLASHYLTTKDPGIINQTIIDGGNTGAVITIANDAAPEMTVTGFTIQNGIDGIFASAKVNILNNQITNNSDGIDYENGSGGDCRIMYSKTTQMMALIWMGQWFQDCRKSDSEQRR